MTNHPLRPAFCLLLCYLFASADAAAQPARPAVALNIQLESLRAATLNQDREVQIVWQAKALGNYPLTGNFWLERSTDGSTWERTATRRPYWLKPRQSETFRMLEQVDEAYRYYRIVARDSRARETVLGAVRYELQKALLYCDFEPHPDIRKLYLNYALERPKQLLLRVYDNIGQQVHTERLPSGTAGEHAHLLDLGQFKSGVYLMVITQIDDNMNIAEYRMEWVGTAPAALDGGAQPKRR